MNIGKKQYSFQWFIEYYSYCWHRNGESLISPEFYPEGLEGTVWYLRLYPRGNRYLGKGTFSLFLCRSRNDNGPKSIVLKYKLWFRAPNETIRGSKELEYVFKKGDSYGCPQLPQMNNELWRRKADDSQQDVLNVGCEIWTGEGNCQQMTQICVATHIGIERIHFIQEVECFSTLEANRKETVEIRSPSKEDCVISSCLYFTYASCREGEITLEITPSSAKYNLSKCNISLINPSRNMLDCGKADNRFDATRRDILKLSLSVTRRAILKRKSEYMPDGKLSLLCECIFSTGEEYKIVEGIRHEIPPVVIDYIRNHNNSAAKLSLYPSALDELKTIYINKLLTDVELKTKTKSFPAHKIILCARSRVFAAMLTHNMKEKITDCIHIDDLEDDIVQQLLLFLYSDNVEDLHWESAVKLYYVGDKYEVEKLKWICSSFLVDNLTTSTASELLLLADTHNDSGLRKVAEDFILHHEQLVFGSDECERLNQTNHQSVANTMHLRCRKNK